MKTIALIIPMQEELNALQDLLPSGIQCYAGPFSYIEINFSGHRLLLMRSGVGKVNTAASLSALLMSVSVDKVINLGSAGGIEPHLKVFDWVIAPQILHHDVDVTPLGFAWGQMLGEPEVYDVDQNLFDCCRIVAESLFKVDHVHYGIIGSGESFIYKPEQIEQIRERFQKKVLCVEMEGAAMAQVCRKFGVGFLAIRCISDNPSSSQENHLDFQKFLDQASAGAANFCLNVLNRYLVNP
jgi:adenosylhomocysteine nucleosidase